MQGNKVNFGLGALATGYGIIIGTGSSECSIDGNTISGDAAAPNVLGAVILLKGPAHSVDGNRVAGNGKIGTGIAAFDATVTALTVVANRVAGTTTNGYSLSLTRAVVLMLSSSSGTGRSGRPATTTSSPPTSSRSATALALTRSTRPVWTFEQKLSTCSGPEPSYQHDWH